jgi:hypothetical protein
MNLDIFQKNPKFTILTTIFGENKTHLGHSVESYDVESYIPPIIMTSEDENYKKIVTIYLTEKLPSEIKIYAYYLSRIYYLSLDPEFKINTLYHPGIYFNHESVFKHVAFYGPYKKRKIQYL